MFLSIDFETVALAYGILSSDEAFKQIRGQFGSDKYDNTGCPLLGNTIEELCAFIEKVANGDSKLRNNWNAIKDTLYIPAALALLNAIKEKLID